MESFGCTYWSGDLALLRSSVPRSRHASSRDLEIVHEGNDKYMISSSFLLGHALGGKSSLYSTQNVSSVQYAYG
jgi:hypothetical protein